jgi:hypothetical protein
LGMGAGGQQAKENGKLHERARVHRLRMPPERFGGQGTLPRRKVGKVQE